MVTSEELIREILLQSRTQPHGREGGWITIRIPGVSDHDLSLYIEEANQRGLLTATEVDSFDASHGEWKIRDITGSGLQFLQETNPS